MFGNISGNKSNIYEQDWSKIDLENFILGYFPVDQEDLLKIDKLNSGNSTKTYLCKINMLLDTYAFLKKTNKYKLKLKSKPWIRQALVRNKKLLGVHFMNNIMAVHIHQMLDC